MNSRGMVLLYEQLLGVQFPKSYKNFLEQRGAGIIDGYKILGILTKNSRNWHIKSVIEGTQLLRWKRPDIARDLITICIRETKALCLDLKRGNGEDAPLVEVDLQSNTPPKPLGKTFREWIEDHETIAKRFFVGWNRIKNRQKEAEGKAITQWKSIIVRVKDYIIGIATFGYNPTEGCLEVDEFLPIDQPHIKKGEATRILLTEMFCRARNYSGCLNVIFTRDLREDKDGIIPEELQNLPEWKYRKPRPIPQQIIELGKKYGIEFKEVEEGKISHEEGVDLWFAMLELPSQIVRQIDKLEKDGYLRKEIIAQVISEGIWSKEEAVWLFLNASRPEAVLLGSDPPEKRLFYADSFNYARAALLATRFKQAIIAEITESITGASLSIEEIEKSKVKCHLEAKENFWILRCNHNFIIPSTWMINNKRIEVKSEELMLLLSRPKYPGNPDDDKVWIEKQIEMLLNSEINAQHRCLLLSNEMINPLILNVIYRDRDVEKIKGELIDIVKNAEEKGIHILFAPTRMHLFLDKEIQKRMQTAKRLGHFPPRKASLKLKLIAVPRKIWKEPNAISNASEDAKTFTSLISEKIDINRYRESFSFNCEAVERSAIQNFPVIAEIKGEESNELLNALLQENKDYKGIMFSYIRPEEIPQFLKRLKSRKLRSIFKKVDGAVIVVSPWESLGEASERINRNGNQPKIDREFKGLLNKILSESKNKKYCSSKKEIISAHEKLQKAIAQNIPLSIAGIRSHIFIQTIREYIYYQEKNKEREKKFLFLKMKERYKERIPSSSIPLKIAYGDGTKGETFPLFSLPKIDRPTGNFLKIDIALVSSRHMEVDYFADFSLMRNAPLQWKENSADQEEYAFKKTYEKIDSLLRFFREEINEEKLEPSLKALLRIRREIKEMRPQGLEIHLYHATGLKPASVGAYRAIIQLLRKYRGQLIVVPRIINERKRRKIIEKFGLNKIEVDVYEKTEEWY